MTRMSSAMTTSAQRGWEWANISWPIAFAPQLAEKDARALPLAAVETFK